MKTRAKRYFLLFALIIISVYIIIDLAKWRYFYKLSSHKPFEQLSSLAFVFIDSNGKRHKYFIDNAYLARFNATPIDKYKPFKYHQEFEVNSNNLFADMVYMRISSDFKYINFTKPSILHNNEADLFIELDEESSSLLFLLLSQFSNWKLSIETTS